MVARIGNVQVVVNTRDEHCPPHVHAECAPEGWDARFKFSFVDDDVTFWDFRPEHPKREPSRRRLDQIGMVIAQNLVTIREEWVKALRGDLCLENKYAQRTPGGAIEIVEGRRLRLPQVKSARYDPQTRTTTVTLSDGTTYQQVI